jgi:SAM-dependent methyltransferase
VEAYGPSTYGDGFADVYDDWYHDAGDPEAAADAIVELAGGLPVLELGVGTGRLAVPVAARGVDVWGLDASEAMLDHLAGRPGGSSVRAVLGDMTDAGAALEAAGLEPPSFGAVVAAFNTFFLLATEDAQRRCLGSAAGLLAPGGRLVVEAYVPTDPPADAETVLEPRRVELDRVVFTISTHLPMEQVVHGQHVELRDGGVRLRPWVLRYATPDQLDGMASDAGLDLVERWGSWQREPFDPGATVHVSIYGRRYGERRG